MPVSANSVLGEDITVSSSIALDVSKASSIGVFINQSLKGHASACMEAIAIRDTAQEAGAERKKVETGGGSPVYLTHVKRSTTARRGWVSQPILKDGDQIVPVAVASGTSQESGTVLVRGFYVDDQGFYGMTLGADGSTWTIGPDSLVDAGAGLPVELQTTHTLGATGIGSLVVYGKAGASDLVVGTADKGGSLTVQRYTLDQPLAAGSYKMTVDDETLAWHLAVVSGGVAYTYTGNLQESGAVSSDSKMTVANADAVVMAYLSAGEALYMIADSSGVIYTCDKNGPVTAVAVPKISLPDNARVTDSCVQVYDGTNRAYIDQFQLLITDSNQRTYLLRQQFYLAQEDTGYGSWLLDSGSGVSYPNWTPLIQLGQAQLAVRGEVFGSEAVTVFTTGATGEIALFSKPTMTGRWRVHPVQTDEKLSSKTRTLRTEFLITDDNAGPLSNSAVTLSTGTDDIIVDVEVNGQVYAIGNAASNLGAQVTTGPDGRLTVTMLNDTGISSSDLSIHIPDTTGRLKDTPDLTVNAGRPVQMYLSGQGTLNKDQPKPPFAADGKALTGSGVSFVSGGGAVAPQASSVIISAAKMGTGQSQPSGSGSFTPPGSPTQQDREMLGWPSFSDLWGDVEQFAGDVWHSIEKGFSELANVVVDTVTSVISFTLKIAGAVVAGFDAVVKAVEDAAKVVASVITSIVQDIEAFYEWLKALLDFQAMWDTKVALESGLAALPAKFSGIVQALKSKEQDFFTTLKTVVDTKLDGLITDLGGDPETNQIGSMPNMQQPNSPSQPAGSTGVQQSDFTNNPHHNFVQAKVTSGGPINTATTTFTASADVSQAVADLKNALAAADTDLATAFTKMETVIKTAAGGSPNVTDMFKASLAAFLEVLEGLIDATIDFTSGVVAAILDLADALLTFFVDFLQEALPVPDFIQDIWDFICSLVDTRGQDTLSLAGLGCLLLAVPSTIIFKIVVGDANAVPFKDGDLNQPYGSADALAAAAPGKGPTAKGPMAPASTALIGTGHGAGAGPGAGSGVDVYGIIGGVLVAISVIPNYIVDNGELGSEVNQLYGNISLAFTAVEFALSTYRQTIDDIVGSDAGMAEVFCIGATLVAVLIGADYLVWKFTTVDITDEDKKKAAKVANYMNGVFQLYKLIETLCDLGSQPKLKSALGIVRSVTTLFTFVLKLNIDAYYASLQRKEIVVICDLANYLGGGILMVLVACLDNDTTTTAKAVEG